MAWTTVAAPAASASGVSRSWRPWPITLSMRIFEVAGSTRPETRAMPVSSRPSASRPRRAQISALRFLPGAGPADRLLLGLLRIWWVGHGRLDALRTRAASRAPKSIACSHFDAIRRSGGFTEPTGTAVSAMLPLLTPSQGDRRRCRSPRHGFWSLIPSLPRSRAARCWRCAWRRRSRCFPARVATETRALPRSAPEAQGVSSAALLGLRRRRRRTDSGHEQLHARAARPGRGRRLVGALRGRSRHLLYSLSKSFTSTAVGSRSARGSSRSTTPCQFFPDDAPAEPSDKLKAMRVRDLLTMSTGHHNETLRVRAPKGP